jgi:hypothetical protein
MPRPSKTPPELQTEADERALVQSNSTYNILNIIDNLTKYEK